ncbi:MAG TPA: hypothetical protein VHV29_06995 [Terriglobales bacterium]|nr:hypothetical protein [Terriglobales bacterium]
MNSHIHMLICPEHGEVPCPVCAGTVGGAKGKKYGHLGGRAAAKGMTAKQRRARAIKAARSRWQKKKKPK